MGYYLVIKKNETTPLAATQMYLQITILSKSDREKKTKIIYQLNVESKKSIIELIYETETDSWTLKTNL